MHRRRPGSELLADVQKLKDAGITPIRLGAGDKWPAMFWYAYLALRIGGADVMQQAAVDHNFNDPAFLEGGKKLQRTDRDGSVPARFPGCAVGRA